MGEDVGRGRTVAVGRGRGVALGGGGTVGDDGTGVRRGTVAVGRGTGVWAGTVAVACGTGLPPWTASAQSASPDGGGGTPPQLQPSTLPGRATRLDAPRLLGTQRPPRHSESCQKMQGDPWHWQAQGVLGS